MLMSMRIAMGVGAQVIGEAVRPQDIVDEVVRAEADGFGRYAGLDNYRRQLEREGVPSPGGLAITGTEPEIETQLRRLADLGVTEFWPIIFPVGRDPTGSRRETRALLTGLAAAP
jgi:hypothetical protein